MEDQAIATPGISPEYLEDAAAPIARIADIDLALALALALAGVAHEAGALTDGLTGLATERWTSEVTLDGEVVNAHWVARHAVHDATHHLLDVEGLRERL